MGDMQPKLLATRPITPTMPAPVLVTARLVLRVLQEGDGPILAEYYNRNAESFGEHQSGWDDFTVMSDLRGTIAARESANAALVGWANRYAVFERKALGGMIALVTLQDAADISGNHLHRLERGVTVDARFRKRGIAREAGSAATFAALTTSSAAAVVAQVSRENEPSLRLMEASGFDRKGSRLDSFSPFTRSGWLIDWELPRHAAERIGPGLRPLVAEDADALVVEVAATLPTALGHDFELDGGR